MKNRVKATEDFMNGYIIKDSSNVRIVTWDYDSNMYVWYKSGGFYMYKGVSRQRAVATALAKSVGSYINAKIKPNYEAVRIV